MHKRKFHLQFETKTAPRASKSAEKDQTNTNERRSGEKLARAGHTQQQRGLGQTCRFDEQEKAHLRGAS